MVAAVLLTACSSCGASGDSSASRDRARPDVVTAESPAVVAAESPAVVAVESPAVAAVVTSGSAAAAKPRDTSRLETRFDPPDGFARVAVVQGSFQAYLRDLELRTDRVQVLSYEQEELDSPSAAVAVLSVGTRDLQQCADSIMRLHAEWLWTEDRADDVGYHFVSGDLSRWKDWRKGERFRSRGSSLERVNGAKADDSHEAFERYLFHVFAYAATRSMAMDSDPVAIGDARAGDFFVQAGSPGHAVLILDIAEHADGRKVALLGQGYMPAQEFHVIHADGPAAIADVWFVLPADADGIVDTPSWKPFTASDLRRFFAR